MEFTYVLVEFIYILWWSLCTLYLLACQVRVTVGDSGLCCVCLTSFERFSVTPLCVDYRIHPGALYGQVICNSYCGKHPEELLRFFCMTCEDTVCRDCRMTDHAEGHKTMDIADLQQSAKDFVCKVNEIIVENFVPVQQLNAEFFKQELEEKKNEKPGLVAAIKEREQVELGLSDWVVG